MRIEQHILDLPGAIAGRVIHLRARKLARPDAIVIHAARGAQMLRAPALAGLILILPIHPVGLVTLRLGLRL